MLPKMRLISITAVATMKLLRMARGTSRTSLEIMLRRAPRCS